MITRVCVAVACTGPAATALAAPIGLDTAAVTDPREVECLAQAISFESGGEPVGGQEAVAQVVLNRLRAPRFPKTVCAVIYQGSTRRTGCQFTFTCDGSLLRRRDDRGIVAARLVAERMLRGGRAAAVGDAVNYHADYVAPSWARSLERVTKIGMHIFYRQPTGSAAPRVADAPTGIATPVPGTFAPWGVPTFAIARTGTAHAIGDAPSVAAEDQIGTRVDPGQ